MRMQMRYQNQEDIGGVLDAVSWLTSIFGQGRCKEKFCSLLKNVTIKISENNMKVTEQLGCKRIGPMKLV